MKKFIKKSLFSALTLIMALSLIFPSLNVEAKNKDAEKYEVKVSYGINGKYRAMKYVPVTVDMKSLEKDFEGEIEIRVASGQPEYYDAYSKTVKIAKGENIKVTIPVMIPESSSKFTVNLLEKGKSVLEQKVMVSTGRITEGNLFAGILTDDVTSLGYLGDIKFTDTLNSLEGGLVTVKLDSNNISDNYLNIDGLDIIFINNFNMGSFSKEHYNVLNAWINKGGTLIIGSGVNESKTVKLIDKSLLEVKSNGISEKNVKLINEDLSLSLSNLEIKNSKVRLGNTGEELIYSIDKEKGRVLVSTFDLGMEPLISSKDASEVWNRILLEEFEEGIDKNMYGKGYYAYEADTLVRNIPVDKLVNVSNLGIILGVYALVVGIVLYIVLKKMNKRDLIWITVPVLAITFSLVIYLIGSNTRVNDLILNQVNIIDIDESGKGQVKGYVGIGTKYKNDVTLEKPQDVVMNFKSSNNGYYGIPGEEKDLSKLRVKTTYKENNSYFDFADSNALEMKMFEVSGKEESLPKIESTFNYDSGKLNGNVKNNLDTNINKLVLVSGENVWDLGSVKKGEELNLDKIDISQSGGVRAYGDELTNKYWNLKWNSNGNKKVDIKSEEFKNITRYGNIFQLLSSEMIFDGESKLIAITDMPIDYGIEFGKKSLSKFDNTALVQDVEIDFKDKDGNINFPQGYFKGVIESATPNVHLDEYSGEIYGDGEVIFKFKVSDEIDIFNIEVSKVESPYGNKGNVDTSDYFIYNHKNSNYEKIDLADSTSIMLSNATDYAIDNNIKIKVVVNEKGSGRIPSLAIKGRVK